MTGTFCYPDSGWIRHILHSRDTSSSSGFRLVRDRSSQVHPRMTLIRGSFPKIPPTVAGNTVGKTTRFQRVSGSTESPNVLDPVARSSLRSLVSVPSPYLDNTHVKLFDKWFCQIIPLGIRHTVLLGTNLFPSFNLPGFLIPSEISRPKATCCFPVLRSWFGGCPWRFFQRPVSGDRHPWYFVTQHIFCILPFSRCPIQRTGHPFTVATCFHSISLGFLQFPRSSSRRPVSRPGLSMCSTWLVLNIIPIQPSAHPNHRTTAIFAKGFSCLFGGGFIVTGFGKFDLHIRYPCRASGAPRKETQETSPGFTTTSYNQVLPRLFMNRHNHPFFNSVSHDNVHLLLSCLCPQCFHLLLFAFVLTFLFPGLRLLFDCNKIIQFLGDPLTIHVWTSRI